MKNILLLICLAAACAETTQVDSKTTKLSGTEITVLFGNHAQIAPRGICEIYQKAYFGGQFTLVKMVTNMGPDEFGGTQPYTTLFFENDVKFGNTPERFNFTTLGGDTDRGTRTTANISMELGETYILFPEERDGGLVLSPDAKFTEDESGNFRNEYLLNKAPVKLNSSAFKQHFLSKKCTDVRPDNEYKKTKTKTGRSPSTTEVGK